MSKVYSKDDSRVHVVRDLRHTECGIDLANTKPCLKDTMIVTCPACAFIQSNPISSPDQSEYGPVARAKTALAANDSEQLYQIVRELEAYITYLDKHIKFAGVDIGEQDEEMNRPWSLEQ